MDYICTNLAQESSRFPIRARTDKHTEQIALPSTHAVVTDSFQCV